eukprot:jgi/Mesvir1/14861/Mv05475-RA.2
MPELPEVEYGRRLLEVYAVGKRISSVIAENDDKIFSGVPAAAIREKLSGKTIVASRRLGKHIWLELDNRPWPSFHFGMTGAFSVKGSQAMKYKEFTVDTSAWPPKFTKFLMKLEGGDEIAFSDPRRFSRIRVLDDPEHSPPISELGFDALLAMPTLEEFSAKLRARTAPVKAVLLDQSFSAGVGNWVADEILYQARVHPSHRASQLSDRQVATLRDKMAYVLETAVGHNADSSFFPSDWMFHMRWGKGRAGAQNGSGHKVAFITVGGRTTAFVPSLQKLSPGQAAEAVEGGEGEGDEVEGAVAGGSVGKGSKKVGARKAVGGSKGSEKGQEKTTPKRKKAGGVVPGDVVVEGELTSSAVTKKTAAPRGRKNNGGATTEHEMQKGEGKRASFPASEDAADVVLTADDAPGAAGVRLAAKGGRARSRGLEHERAAVWDSLGRIKGVALLIWSGSTRRGQRGSLLTSNLVLNAPPRVGQKPCARACLPTSDGDIPILRPNLQMLACTVCLYMC